MAMLCRLATGIGRVCYCAGESKSTPRTTVRVNTTGQGITVSFNLTGLAQEWVSSPGGNWGLLLRPNLISNTSILQYRFASANHWDANWRPKLVVTYTGGGQAYNPGRPPGHTSLAMQPTPEATPPANHTWRSYYHAAGRRVVLRVQDGSTGVNQVHYLFADHLSSSNVSRRGDGSQTVTQRYYPWDTVRSRSNNALPTGYTYTGQLDTGAGLMYYGARYYDAALGRFIQPDTIVPEVQNPQALNRYSYVLNNPLRFIDDSGKMPIDIVGGGGGGAGMAVVMLISGLAQTAGQQASALTVRLAPAANATM